MTLDRRLMTRSADRVQQAPGRAVARVGLPAALLVVAVVAFYAWTAGVTTADSGDLQYYDNIADALVHGRLDLRPSPPAGLLALRDPYDPAASQPYRDMGFHDLVLYKGRFYATWGPAPAVVLFAPLRLVGIDLSHSVAAFLLAFGAWAFACGALLFAARRWLPASPRWMLFAGAVILATGNLAPFLLRRPKVYEVAVLGGMCFAMGAVYFLMTGGLGRRPVPWRLALGSLCLGLAAGSRPQLAVGIVPAALLARHVWRRVGRVEARRCVAALAVPVGVCLALLLAYNQARFGSPFNVGNTHQISAMNSATFDWGSLSYVVPNLWDYLVAMPSLVWQLPFHGTYSILVPRGYPFSVPAAFTDPGPPMGGLLVFAPIVLLLGGLPFLRRRWPELRAVAASLVACGVVGLVFIAYLVLPIERYAGDFTGLFVLGALLVWLMLVENAQSRPRARASLAVAGTALGAWTAVVGVVMSAPATIGH